MGTPTASIVIRAYNERESLTRLLHGISQQTLDDVEIVLVDSGSTDGTRAIARQYAVDEIIHLPPERFTYGRGLNYGCRAASGTYCVFASAHTFPRRTGWIENLLEGFDDRTALVYGAQRGGDATAFSEQRMFEQWFPDHDIDEQPHAFCHNANAAVRRDLWQQFSYDEDVGGLEDVDWATRVRQAGYEVAYASNAEVVHVHDESPTEVVDRYRREVQTLTRLTGRTLALSDALRLWWTTVRSDARAARCRGHLPTLLAGVVLFRTCQSLGAYCGSRDAKSNDSEVTASERADLWNRYFGPDTSVEPAEAIVGKSAAERGERITYASVEAPYAAEGTPQPRHTSRSNSNRGSLQMTDD